MRALIKAGVAGLLLLLFLWSCDFNQEPARMSGETMGTRWHVSAELPTAQSPEKLTVVLSRRWTGSEYLVDCNLSDFNRAPQHLQWVVLDPIPTK